MDDIRNSFSRLKKDLKHRFRGEKHAPDRMRADAAGETTSSPVSLLRPDPRVITSSHNEGGGISADPSQTHSGDRSPRPEPMPADEGRNHPQGREVDIKETEVGRCHSRLDPDAEVAVGDGSSRKIGRTSSPRSVIQGTPKQEPDGTWALFPHLPCSTIRLHAVDTSMVPDIPQDENAEAGVSTNEKKSSWKSTALATAKLLLRGVRDSADAFGPLKSVAGGLCFILENCEVWYNPCPHNHDSYQYPSE